MFIGVPQGEAFLPQARIWDALQPTHLKAHLTFEAARFSQYLSSSDMGIVGIAIFVDNQIS